MRIEVANGPKAVPHSPLNRQCSRDLTVNTGAERLRQLRQGAFKVPRRVQPTCFSFVKVPIQDLHRGKNRIIEILRRCRCERDS